MFYYLFALMRSGGLASRTNDAPSSGLSELYSYFGVISLLAVLRFEFPTAWVAAGWAIVSVALMILGRSISVEAFRVQATFVTLLVLARCVFENLSLPNETAWMNLRLASTASVISTFMLGFVLAKLLPKSDRNLASIHRGHKMAPSYGTDDFVLTEKGVTAVAGAGSIRWALRACDRSAHHFYFFSAVGLVTALIGREIGGSDYLTVGWAVEGIVVFVLALFLKERSYRLFAMAVFLVCTARIFLLDVWQLTTTNLRVTCIGTVAVILLAGFTLSRLFAPSSEESAGTVASVKPFQSLLSFDRVTHHFFFFSAVGLVTLLIWREATAGGYLTAAWAVEALVVFILAVLLNERAYRLLGMALLLVCTAKIVSLDVWQLHTLERIIAFIVLGAVLVLVSFFYTHYRESWRRILLGH
jgi:hypothetical protein